MPDWTQTLSPPGACSGCGQDLGDAVPAALGTAYLLLTAIDAGNPQRVSTPLVVPWAQVGLAIGVAALLVMVVSLAALPALRRVTRPDAVHFE